MPHREHERSSRSRRRADRCRRRLIGVWRGGRARKRRPGKPRGQTTKRRRGRRRAGGGGAYGSSYEINFQPPTSSSQRGLGAGRWELIGLYLASTLARASKRSDQYCLSRLAASRSRSLVCCTATTLFERPFAMKPTATMLRSSPSRRIDLDGIAVRTLPILLSSHPLRRPASAQASNNVATGTLKVRELFASYVPSRR